MNCDLNMTDAKYTACMAAAQHAESMTTLTAMGSFLALAVFFWAMSR